MTALSVGKIADLLKSLTIFLVTLDLYLEGVNGAEKGEVDQHLEMGKKLLAAGQLADALSHYHAAVEGDPDNYMTYYKRATVLLALGKSRTALPDLDKVIELQPDFTAARTQRGNVYLKQGHLDAAKADFAAVLIKDPNNAEAQRQHSLLDPIKQDIEFAKHQFQSLDYQSTIDIMSKVIEICQWDPELREIRAESYIAQGEYIKAMSDIRSTTKLRQDNTKAYYQLSLLHYDMGEADESLIQIRECLKLDPDHKDCFPHYKKVKKLVKQMQSAQAMSSEGRSEECIQKSEQILETEPVVFPYVLKAKSHICHCHSQSGDVKKAVDACNQVLEMDGENVDAICDRAEAYILNEQYEEAMNEFQKAQNINQESRRAQEGLNKAQKLLKNSQKRDYYKILGLRRNAKKKEILKTYRKLAAKWHPDRYNGEDKKMAEKKFYDIAAAKEVLSDPELRQKYDNGEDPLDPEQQQGGPHWHQGFNPFGNGGGFGFKFHFN